LSDRILLQDDRLVPEDDFIEHFEEEPKALQQGLLDFAGRLPVRDEDRVILGPRRDPEEPSLVRYVVRVEGPTRSHPEEDVFDITDEYSSLLSESLEREGARDLRSKVYVQVVPPDVDR
jgi:hypothetical protein